MKTKSDHWRPFLDSTKLREPQNSSLRGGFGRPGLLTAADCWSGSPLNVAASHMPPLHHWHVRNYSNCHLWFNLQQQMVKDGLKSCRGRSEWHRVMLETEPRSTSLGTFCVRASWASWTWMDASPRTNKAKLMTVTSKDVSSCKTERTRRGVKERVPPNHLVQTDASPLCQRQFSAQTTSLPCVYLSPSLLPSDHQLFRLRLATVLLIMFRRWLPSFPASSGVWSETPLAAPAPPLEPESSGETKTANIFIKLAASEQMTPNPVNFNRGENKHPLVLFTESSWWSHNFCTHLLLQLTWITATR